MSNFCQHISSLYFIIVIITRTIKYLLDDIILNLYILYNTDFRSESFLGMQRFLAVSGLTNNTTILTCSLFVYTLYERLNGIFHF